MKRGEALPSSGCGTYLPQLMVQARLPLGIVRDDVWSGDLVRKDEGGYLFFVGRNDEMIKTSGYRVSPTEIEEVVFQTGLAAEAAAIGVADDVLAQAIVVVATSTDGEALAIDRIAEECRRRLPLYMVPRDIFECDSLPRNANGKIDRKRIRRELMSAVGEGADE